jgi:replicative DNA helicase
MHTYHLQDEFRDPAAERQLLAAIAQQPTLYFELLDALPTDVFTDTQEVWQQLARALVTDQPLSIPPDWESASDPHAVAQYLADLHQRRLHAATQERLAAALFDSTIPTSTLATILEEEALRVQTAIRETAASRLQWASDLVPEVLAVADARRQQREQTGKAVLGVSTGLTGLDEVLNGLTEGLYLLAGPPGLGKTTLALQLATHATRDVPVVFVTFENAPASLTLKALCAAGGVNPQDVYRGQADLARLHTAAQAWQPVAARLALVEGSGRLTVAQVRAQALRAMQHHGTPQCLVIVDYLQLWAKVAEELRGGLSVRERVELLGGALRELAARLHSPVLALASQNRAQGHYGNGKGTAALDSLKESGDLEYMADVVLFLTETLERQSRPPARAVDLTIAKNRHGDIGKLLLIFRPDHGTLREEARV